jgi:hypothetical protein
MSKKSGNNAVARREHAEPVAEIAAVGPQIKRRETWVELPGDYAGFKFRLWVNAPARIWNDLNSDTEEAALAALQQLILEHNGWRDFDGEPYPPANESAFWEAIPTELAACILVASQSEMQKLPNSIAPQRRRSRRG